MVVVFCIYLFVALLNKYCVLISSQAEQKCQLLKVKLH